jgi:hypothetical protein
MVARAILEARRKAALNVSTHAKKDQERHHDVTFVLLRTHTRTKAGTAGDKRVAPQIRCLYCIFIC